MMGELPKDQGTLLYDFCLEKFVPEDHLLRRIDQFLDFEPIRQHLAPFYSAIGRPSVDPDPAYVKDSALIVHLWRLSAKKRILNLSSSVVGQVRKTLTIEYSNKKKAAQVRIVLRPRPAYTYTHVHKRCS